MSSHHKIIVMERDFVNARTGARFWWTVYEIEGGVDREIGAGEALTRADALQQAAEVLDP